MKFRIGMAWILGTACLLRTIRGACGLFLGLPSITLKQIKKRDSFDGTFADTILEMIRSFLQPLNAATIISLWRETEVGMGDETEDDRLFPACARMDVEMEMLQQLTDLAWYEATGKWPKRQTRNPDDADD